jgi:hypothetical protein
MEEEPEQPSLFPPSDKLKDLFPPNPHPPGTELKREPIKKRRRRKGPQDDSGWSDKIKP